MGEGDLHAIIALTLGATNQKQRTVAVRTGPLASQQWSKRKRGICSDGFGFFFAHDDVVVSPLQFFQEYIGVPSQQLKSLALVVKGVLPRLAKNTIPQTHPRMIG